MILSSWDCGPTGAISPSKDMNEKYSNRTSRCHHRKGAVMLSHAANWRMACLQWPATPPIIKLRQPFNLCLPALSAQHQNWLATSKKKDAKCRFWKWSEELHVHRPIPSKRFIDHYYYKLLLQNEGLCVKKTNKTAKIVALINLLQSSECSMGFALAQLNTQHLYFGDWRFSSNMKSHLANSEK